MSAFIGHCTNTQYTQRQLFGLDFQIAYQKAISLSDFLRTILPLHYPDNFLFDSCSVGLCVDLIVSQILGANDRLPLPVCRVLRLVSNIVALVAWFDCFGLVLLIKGSSCC